MSGFNARKPVQSDTLKETFRPKLGETRRISTMILDTGLPHARCLIARQGTTGA
ncbi:hypothetical protein [Roseomonas sp. SXEYE001]|uniref:hypothetical protein n=1 Tax=Roseomonas xinghualingensis TaxID=2986475 RepID=UPI0038D3EB87